MDSAHDEEAGAVRTRGASEVAGQATEAVKSAAGDVAATAKEQLLEVAGEVKEQTRNVAGQMRDRVAEQARVQSDNLSDGIRRISDELDTMAAERPDSLARTVVVRIAEGGHQMADQLARRGPEGVLADVQEFARRRPGAFLATALVSGFVVGRLGRGVMSAGSQSTAHDEPGRDSLTQFRDEPSPAGPGAPAVAEPDELVYSTATASRPVGKGTR
jgi:hypothetical protein